MVKANFDKRLRGHTSEPLPQELINIFLSDQRLLYVVADHLGQVHYISEFRNIDDKGTVEFLKAIFSADPFLRQSYNQINVILSSNKSLLSPINENSSLSELTHYFLQTNKTKSHNTDTIPSEAILNTYVIENQIKEEVISIFQNAHILHLHSVLIELFTAITANLPGNRIYSYISERYLSLLFFKDCKLQFVNQFVIESREDVVYYTMLIYNQFALDPSEDQLSVCGDIEDITIFLNDLQAYIQNIRLLKWADDNSTILGKEKSKYYLPLSSVANIQSLRSNSMSQ